MVEEPELGLTKVSKNALSNHCHRACRKLLNCWVEYGRRDEPHKTEVEAIERLSWNNIVYNTTLNSCSHAPHRLVKIKLVRDGQQGLFRPEQVRVNHRNIWDTTFDLRHFMPSRVPGAKKPWTRAMNAAWQMHLRLSDRAMLHNVSHWSKLPKRCLPISWFDRTKEKVVANDTYDGGCEVCTYMPWREYPESENIAMSSENTTSRKRKWAERGDLDEDSSMIDITPKRHWTVELTQYYTADNVDVPHNPTGCYAPMGSHHQGQDTSSTILADYTLPRTQTDQNADVDLPLFPATYAAVSEHSANTNILGSIPSSQLTMPTPSAVFSTNNEMPLTSASSLYDDEPRAYQHCALSPMPFSHLLQKSTLPYGLETAPPPNLMNSDAAEPHDDAIVLGGFAQPTPAYQHMGPAPLDRPTNILDTYMVEDSDISTWENNYAALSDPLTPSKTAMNPTAYTRSKNGTKRNDVNDHAMKMLELGAIVGSLPDSGAAAVTSGHDVYGTLAPPGAYSNDHRAFPRPVALPYWLDPQLAPSSTSYSKISRGFPGMAGATEHVNRQAATDANAHLQEFGRLQGVAHTTDFQRFAPAWPFIAHPTHPGVLQDVPDTANHTNHDYATSPDGTSQNCQGLSAATNTVDGGAVADTTLLDSDLDNFPELEDAAYGATQHDLWFTTPPPNEDM